jgi:FkbM family methyltransferase
MNNIYIDGGTHYGQGLDHFINSYNMNSEWKIYSFEANPVTYEKFSHRRKYSFVNYINKALLNYDGHVEINLETVGENDDTGMGSSVITLDKWDPWKGQLHFHRSIKIECIDLSAFIKNNFKQEDNIICKLDVEGAEYDILEKMINDDTINYIKTLCVEFHSGFFKNQEEIKIREDKIREIIKKMNISFIEWH